MGKLGLVLLVVGLYNNQQHGTNTGDCDLQFPPYTADFFRLRHSLLNDLLLLFLGTLLLFTPGVSLGTDRLDVWRGVLPLHEQPCGKTCLPKTFPASRLWFACEGQTAMHTPGLTALYSTEIQQPLLVVCNMKQLPEKHRRKQSLFDKHKCSQIELKSLCCNLCQKLFSTACL